MPTRVDARKAVERKLFAESGGIKIPISVFEHPEGNSPDAPLVLVIYGGGIEFTPGARNPTKLRFVERRFLAASFIFRGHIPGTNFYETGLWSRIEDARAVLALLAKKYPTHPIAIYAVSMGGYVATFLQPELVKHLILIAPGAYHPDAVAKKLNFSPKDTGGPFTNLIRQTDSWKNSDGFENIRKFSGSSLVVIGFTRDEVVRWPEIPKTYHRNHPEASKKTITWLPYSHMGNYLDEGKMVKLTSIAAGHIAHYSASK